MSESDHAGLLADIRTLAPELEPAVPQLPDMTVAQLRDLLASLRAARAAYVAAGLIEAA